MTAKEERNIIDYYHYWKTEAIKADLNTKRHNFSILISNKLRDFNIGTVIRNSNAFLGAKIYVYGRKRFDRRGTVGTHHYENLVYINSLDELPEGKLIAMDNVPGAKAIESFEWPDEHFTMIFGQEQVGVPDELLEVSDDIVYITQYGSVRSLNVGVASGIAMFDYLSKKGSK
jgi:tRNA G18 (ribose-2'-O)-methylase SpoU